MSRRLLSKLRHCASTNETPIWLPVILELWRLSANNIQRLSDVKAENERPMMPMASLMRIYNPFNGTRHRPCSVFVSFQVVTSA